MVRNRVTPMLVVLLVVGGPIGAGVTAAAPSNQVQEDCGPSSENLDTDSAFDDSEHTQLGGTLFWEASNVTAVDAANDTARIELAADSGRGLGAVGSFGYASFSSKTWTAPCTGTYTVTVEYELSGNVSQERSASAWGNGVSRVDVQSRLSVGNVSETATWQTVGQNNSTEWFSLIPRLEDLEQDAVRNFFAAIVNQFTGLPGVGEIAAEEVGIERNRTELSDSLSNETRTITATFQADRGSEYDVIHTTEAAVLTVGIVNGESNGQISVATDLQRVQVSPEPESGANDNESSSERVSSLEAIRTEKTAHSYQPK